MEKEIVSAIQKFIKIKRDEENILNIIVRDDVFAILEKECCVLYYSLDDDIDRVPYLQTFKWGNETICVY